MKAHINMSKNIQNIGNVNSDTQHIADEYSDPNNRWYEQDIIDPLPSELESKNLPLSQVDKETGRRQHELKNGQIHHSASAAESLMIAANVPFYVRGDTIVQPVIEYSPTADGRRVPSPRLKTVSSDGLVDHMSRTISFVKYSDKYSKNIPVNPPKELANIILSRDGEWKFPYVSGIITSPTLRRDGSIIWRDGYDPKTQLLLIDPPKLPSDMPEFPTRDDALNSIKLLDDLISSFPFVDDISKSVALSGLITPVVRGAMAVSPMHVMSAPTAGSGKSFLVDICSAILSGIAAPVISAGANEEELEKRLATELMNARPIVTIDNVNGRLYGDLLCQAVERPSVRVRILGQSKSMEIENRNTIFATGNNIHVADDMTRRVILCTLDANVERPELRQFSFNPFTEVIENRGKYIAAILTIARAYILAGRPDKLPELASFSEWSNLVRSAIVWLGYRDPCDSIEKVRAEDTGLTSLRSFVSAWVDIFGSYGKTASDVFKESQNSDTDQALQFQLAVSSFAANSRGVLTAVGLGKKLSQVEGKVVDGIKITSRFDGHKKIKIWFMESIEKRDNSVPDLIDEVPADF